MHNLLLTTAAIMAISGAAFAQSANNGAGATGPDVSTTVTSGNVASPANTRRAAHVRRARVINRRNGIISSNGARTTNTGGITRGVGTTLSPRGGGGNLGNESGETGK